MTDPSEDGSLHRPKICMDCGYDASRVVDRCPECGADLQRPMVVRRAGRYAVAGIVLLPFTCLSTVVIVPPIYGSLSAPGAITGAVFLALNAIGFLRAAGLLLHLRRVNADDRARSRAYRATMLFLIAFGVSALAVWSAWTA